MSTKDQECKSGVEGAAERGPNYDWKHEARHYQQTCEDLRRLIGLIDRNSEKSFQDLYDVRRELKQSQESFRLLKQINDADNAALKTAWAEIERLNVWASDSHIQDVESENNKLRNIVAQLSVVCTCEPECRAMRPIDEHHSSCSWDIQCGIKRKSMTTRPKEGHEGELYWLRGYEEARNYFLIKNAELKEALEKIAAVTYGTELCNTDEENNEILASHFFYHQRIARKVLEEVRTAND